MSNIKEKSSDEKMKLIDLDHYRILKSETSTLNEDYLKIEDINLDDRIFEIEQEFNELKKTCK